MCLDRSTLYARPLRAIATRVQEIVRFCGFGPRDRFVQLFGEKPGSSSYDMWEQFCTYSNSFPDELYEDFVERCVPTISLDYLFVLLERCAIIGRERLLHRAIDVRQSYASDDLSLSALEQAFTSACDSGRTELAAQLLKAAKDILAQERFANSRNHFFIRIRNTWESYEYKWRLLELFEANKSDPENFEKLAYDLTIPHKLDASFGQPRANHEECEYFRRQLIAIAFSDADPEKSVRFMDYLYRQSKRSHHGFVLLYVHIKLFAIDKDKTRLQHALASFLNSAGKVEPEQMIETWVTSVLDAYQLLGAPEIDDFWIRLSAEQQTRIHILTPYCKTLIARGDALMARKILTRYQKLNKLTPDDLGIDDLISELSRVEESQPSMSELIQLINEGSQRSILQLQKHYSQIISKDFEAYVEIVKPDQPPHEYLKDAVLAVASELVLRKRNLQVEKFEKGKISYQIMMEDLINDWFTSLFEQRMSQARMAFRDQKRAGHSASGKNPGEIDGFITSSDNTRHAIFESFRLFSLDKTVISQHLNKIAGYDAESLSPVFVVGYCDVKNFSELVMSYGPYVSNQQYAGYTMVEGSSGEMTVLHNTDHIWLGMENRRRDRKNIFIYHFLINLHFSHSTAVTQEQN
ncbi:hypothetical protein Q3H58_004049 [Pseudomonas psychrotolerans]|nr:hypothetical protein [Pseudomonas psychrotolerans]